MKQRTSFTLDAILLSVVAGARIDSAHTANSKLSGIVCSMESATDSEYQIFKTATDELLNVNEVKSRINDIENAGLAAALNTGLEEISEAQWQAGRIIAAAGGDIKGYHSRAIAQPQNESTLPFHSTGTNGSVDNFLETSFEEFDEQEIRNFIPMSTVYNIQAARQDKAGELMYKTVTLTPDNACIQNKLRMINVYNTQDRAITGKDTDWNTKRLIDAFVDHTILLNNGTQNVPVYVAGNSENISQFMAAGLAAPRAVVIDGENAFTSFLRTNAEVDIIGLSQAPRQLRSGYVNETDNLDSRIYLTKLVTTIDGKAVPFKVEGWARSSWVPSTEGLGQEMTLHFPANGLVLDDKSTAADGTLISALTGMGGLAGANKVKVYLKATVTGRANLALATLAVNSVPFSSYTVIDEDGAEVPAPVAMAAALKDLTIDGFDHYSARTNMNRRTRGRRVDTREVNERVATFLGAPFSTPRPAVGEQNDTEVLNRLVTAVRLAASNEAITNLLNRKEAIQNFYTAYSNGVSEDDCPRIEGLGQWLVRPYFREYDVEVPSFINSMETKDLTANVSSLLVNHLRVNAYEMLRESRYLPALQVLSGSNEVKPHLGVVTDIVLPQYLQMIGDTRTLGIGMDHTIAATPDNRFRNKIFMSFVRPSVEGIDPLAWGNYLFVPELAGSLTLSVGGATYREAAVQPRRRHYHNLPCCVMLNVENLVEALTERTALLITGSIETTEP